jgi:hypothetical protein
MKLVGYSADAIEWAFGEYLSQQGDVYFPKPGQIIGLCRRFFEEKKKAAEAEETDRQMRENLAVRQRLADLGEPSGLAQYHAIMKRALDSLVKLPPEPTRKAVNAAKRRVKDYAKGKK